MSEQEPHVPDKSSNPDQRQGSDPTPSEPPAGQPVPPESHQPPAEPPPGSPLAPPPGSSPPPAAHSPEAPAPGPMQAPNYPPQQPGYQQPGYPPAQGYPPQQQGYPPQQPGYPPQQPGYPPQPGYPQRPAPYQQQAPGYPAQRYQPGPTAVRRPPLTHRQRNGAMIAGAVAFTLMSLGFSLVVIPLGIALLGAFIGSIINWVTSSRGGGDFEGREQIQQFLADGWGLYGGWLIAAAIAGVIIWILGYLASIWILRGHGVHRAVGVTWAGLGIAIVANWVISGVLSPLSGLGGLMTPDFDRGGVNGPNFDPNWFNNFNFAPFIVLGVFVILVSLLANAVIGLLSWWWMAHALRERPPASEPSEDTRPAPPAEAPLP